ncbi:MAG: hypothetical protein HY898_07350 [Deltaproteobacteria bacterium]|nr:hypothetical protein [Deltaproteobacteria bacterium]
MGLLNTDKFKPTLFVGLGGNGGKVVNLLATKIKRHPNWDRVQQLTHFVVIDTNKDDLDKHQSVPADCRFLVSSFDRRAYIARKRGRQELPEDRLVTQWVHPDYEFRAAQAAGAGQIRVESRLGLYYNLEDDTRAGIRAKLTRILEQATARENPWRDNQDKVVRVVLYGSVAGGTGSGGFLPIAYLLYDLIADFGWGRPNVIAVLTLPTAFLDKVKPQLHPDILANGYAGLKELEYLTRQLGYPGGKPEIEFHYDPGNRDPSRQQVSQRPFNLVYLVDRPAQVSIEHYEKAIADASFLQIFSPLLGAQSGEYDNYDKHQKSLALGHFSVLYATFGTAILHLPRRDLIRYASLRYVARAFREFLCFGGDEPQFRVPYGDPVFERLDPQQKELVADQKFEQYVGWRANLEEQADEKGVFSAVHAQTGTRGKPLAAEFRARLEGVYGRLDELVQIPDIERQAINPGSPSLARPLAVLRKEYADARTNVRVYLEAQTAELRNGRFFASFFKDLDINPIAQRLFLIKLLKDPFIVPFEDPSEGEFLRAAAGVKADLDSSLVQEEVKRLEGDLSRTATPGWTKRMIDSENKDFQSAKMRAVRKYEELAQDHREDLRRYFWRSFETELRQAAGALMTSFRKVAEVADEHARLAEAETERFRADPGAFPDSDVAAYYLDAEVMRDDRRQERLWHLLYQHHLDKASFFDTQKIFGTVTGAFSPGRDPDGRLRARDASEIVQVVKTSLLESAQGVYSQALVDIRLDLASGLELEQRYIALLDRGADFTDLRRKGKLDDEVRAVPTDVVHKGIEDRLRRLSDECALLAHIDSTKLDDPTVVPANVFLVGLASRFNTDEPGCLGKLLRGVVSGISHVEGWDDTDSLVLYRAMLGIPVYWFRNVQSMMYPAYRSVRDNPNRSYPLHIEAAWETSASQFGLPDLDPVEVRKARERDDADRQARQAAESRKGRVKAFTSCLLFGSVVEDTEGFKWTYGGASRPLAKDRAAAFAAFEALDPTLRHDLEEEASQQWSQRAAERGTRGKLREEVRAHLAKAKAAFALAVADQRDADRRLLEEERAVIEAMDAELGA